ncbi:hypothetical protein SLA2020_035630 [Shorea laevis]
MESEGKEDCGDTGLGVSHCRLKTSWTPPESYPDFQISDTANIRRTDDFRRVEPHAFVHFAAPQSVTWALEAAGRCELFLNNKPLKVSLGPENPFSMNQRGRDTYPFKLSDVQLEIGTLVSRNQFLIGWKGPPSGVDFLVDPFDGRCRFCFSRDTAFSFKNVNEHALIKCEFKVEFLVRDINEMNHYSDPTCIVLLLQLASAPWIWYRTADDDIKELVPFDLLDDNDPWTRTTDFTPSGAVGRCNIYRVLIPPCYGAKLRKAIQYLKGQRVNNGHITLPLKVRNEPEFGILMSDPFFSTSNVGIPFEIMFLVNAVMHKGIFNQHRLSESFFDLLRNQLMEVNLAALKHIYSSEYPVFDASRRLQMVPEWLLRNPKLFKTPKQPDNVVEVRRLAIAPTKAYCLPPEVEISNRVLRKYNEVADQLLRVTFMDEGMQTMNANVLTYYVAPIVRDLTSNLFPQKTRVFERIKSILSNGFYMCSRQYTFLAFSSNQLRDRSAWFFAEDGEVTVQGIKAWMGKFDNKNIAKCAARMGQCFSSTYATVEVPPAEVTEIPDIERNNYVFSDGIGTITPDLAMEVAEKLNLEISPCAYQIRYAGCKGVVACWPAKGDGIRLSLRPSMNKFQSNHRTLEICSWTQFQPCFLNRQIITLLSTLDVPDEVFWGMQTFMLSKLNKILVDTDVAFEVLTSSCAEQGNTAAIMLSAGFKPQEEAHLQGMLTCIRAGQLWGLREKARIFVPSGRWLMGCLDELGVLERGQCFIQVSTPSLENCFSKHGSRFSEAKRDLLVIKGSVVVAKNPCLHPGDIRILEAIDAPGLHHLYDCFVFPQKGERPHANEASGSDLDGDLYFVTWDENLIPPSKQSWTPMQTSLTFFVKNMVNESLGTICNAPVVHADMSEYGALDEKCIRLAELAATAVDSPKTGKMVTMPSDLKPRQMYDGDISAPAGLEFVPGDVPYDKDLEVPGSVDYIADAWEKKCSYDGQMNGLLGQYKVKREEEVVTGHMWSMPKYASRKQGELKERLKHSHNAMKKEFRQLFENLGSDVVQLSADQKNTLYERKASAWYQVAYHPEYVNKSLAMQESGDAGSVLTLSFAWIAADYLARIKIRRQGPENFDLNRPVNSLMRYLTDRMAIV